MQITIEILRTSGKHETLSLERGRDLMNEIAKAIGARVLDTVNLRDGRVMLIDDDGYVVHEQRVARPDGGTLVKMVPMAAKKPPNADATQLYWNICKPGTTHKIVGDVAIAWDRDFA